MSLSVFLIIGIVFVDTAEGKVAKKDLFARDGSLLLSSIMSSNGDLIVEYSLEEDERQFDLLLTEDCEIRIFDRDDKTTYKSYFCLDNKFIKKTRTEVNLNKMKIMLKENILVLEEI